MRTKRNRLPLPAVSALGMAKYWATEIRDRGLADDHRIFPNQPLTAAQRRDAETIIRAIDRLLESNRSAMEL